MLVGVKLISLISFQEFLKSEIFNRISRDDIVVLTNEVRQENGLPQLAVSPVLQEAAKLKLADMLQNNYFAHTSPAGVSPWYWFEKAKYSYKLAGENLAMDFAFSQDVVDAWMGSESHRKNLLLKDFSETGIAVGSGIINGHETAAIVQVFGTPKETKAAAKPIAVKTPAPTPKPSVFAPAWTSKPPAPTPKPPVYVSGPVQIVSSAPKETLLPTRLAPISLAKEVAQAVSSNVKAAYNSDIVKYTPRIVNQTTNWALIELTMAAVAILVFNIFIAFRIQFPALIFRAVLLVIISGWMVWSGPNVLSQEEVIITRVAELDGSR
ncbi:MAG: CAP domain-containing protein [Candidatus Paceibacterota bacterium]